MDKLEDLRSQIVCTVADEELGLLGYLVIDRTVGGKACGGIRLKPDITVTEVAHLARSMTLKFSFANVSQGGAKAGVVGSPWLSRVERRARLVAFGRNLGPFLRSGLYVPGPDLGTSCEDIAIVRQAAGLRGDACLVETGYYTACSIFIALRQAAMFKNLDLAGSTAAIEGFGKVGSNVAKLLDSAGIRIVAVSTLEGAIYNQQGLNVRVLTALRERMGDELVHNYSEAELLEKPQLLTLRTDFLVPCAGPWTIHGDNAVRVQAKIIVPGANIPFTCEAEEILFQRGILCVPDFVANCGGGLASFIAWFGFGKDDIDRLFDDELSSKVDHVLAFAKQREINPRLVAEEIAWQNLQQMVARWSDGRDGTRKRWAKLRRLGGRGVLERIGTEIHRHNLIPSEVFKSFALSYFKRSRLS